MEKTQIEAIINGTKIETFIKKQKKSINEELGILVAGYAKQNMKQQVLMIPIEIYQLVGKWIPNDMLDVWFWNKKIKQNKEECEKLNDILGKMIDQQVNIENEYSIYYDKVHNNNN